MSIDTFKKLKEEKQLRIISSGLIEFSSKTYIEASTDNIVKNSEISKGLLFHYFGSKKNFYLYCLEVSFNRLTKETEIPTGDFYDVLFKIMDDKMKLCVDYKQETLFVNMASKESSSEVANEKKLIFLKYANTIHSTSLLYIERAIEIILTKSTKDKQVIKNSLLLYCNAIMNKYLLMYQNNPMEFFNNSSKIKEEMKKYIDIMLYGIIDERN